MSRRCCEYSFAAHSAADRSTGELLACPRSRWQALLNRLDRAGWLRLAGPGVALGARTLPLALTGSVIRIG